MNAGAQGVDHQLRNADQYGTHTLVTDAENLFAIAASYDIDFFRRTSTFHGLLDLTRLLNIEVAALRPSKQSTVVSNRITFGWRIDDWEHLLEMVLDETVVEHLILVLHAGHESVLPKRCLASIALIISAGNLLLERVNPRREKAIESELLSFFFGESGAFVEERFVKQR